MSREILAVTTAEGVIQRYALDVFAEGEHWTSTLARLDAGGNPLGENVAPRFYGTSADAARRRMLTILENQFEDVRVVQEA